MRAALAQPGDPHLREGTCALPARRARPAEESRAGRRLPTGPRSVLQMARLPPRRAAGYHPGRPADASWAAGQPPPPRPRRHGRPRRLRRSRSADTRGGRADPGATAMNQINAGRAGAGELIRRYRIAAGLSPGGAERKSRNQRPDRAQPGRRPGAPPPPQHASAARGCAGPRPRHNGAVDPHGATARGAAPAAGAAGRDGGHHAAGLGMPDALPDLPGQPAATVPVVVAVAIMCQAGVKAECFQGLVCSRRTTG
jgi:hypothetical protein